MVPGSCPESVPMFTRLANEPPASDNCAVKIFPALATPLLVNDTFRAEPLQYSAGVIGEVVIVVAVTKVIVKFTFEMSKKIFPTASTLTLARVVDTAGKVTGSLPSFAVLAIITVG